MELSRDLDNLQIVDLIGLYGNLGMFYNHVNSHNLSIRYYQKALTYCKQEANINHNVPYMHMMMGKSYARLKEFKKAHYHMEKALRIAKKMDNRENTQYAYTIFTFWADVYSDSG